ncbi:MULTISPECIES: adenylate/guanylate cyclase domain-containing protein [unclassified Phenylobacterium]|jgi:adenylate cyclase|uniref:adenylate/guanylate cyclase domain-containing protein n=1 Tax=unclassified Phenylobacterium TaxID=2640670 RepID=UPI0009E9AB77|nr:MULTISPECIES: adenylate/guanylate cyclase domain-containing protein [unclassified Phenylobacterium]
MSETHFDTAATAKALRTHLSGWFGTPQVCSHDAPTDRSAVVRLNPGCSAACGGTSPGACGPVGACGSDAEPPACDLAAQLRAEQQRGREMERVLSQYVSPGVLERLMADPDGIGAGSETRDVTVLFADLQGFTSLAEALKDNPGRLADLINAFLDPMTDIVLAHGGTIDKYMGDCIMAFWGAPAHDPAQASHAFDAAQAMIAAMDEVRDRFRAIFAEESEPPPVNIGISIGINSGDCIVGNVGSRRRFDYSVLGDPVNVASRLEELCKAYDTPLLIGEETARRLGQDAGLTAIGRVGLRGRSQRLGVFALGQPAREGLAA